MKRIEKLTSSELDRVMEIYADARKFMRASGNLTQWSGGYPSEALVRRDISDGKLYACKEEDDILGVFYFSVENDPTYAEIYDGSWLNDREYAVIHRIAVSAESHGRGVARFIFDDCFAKYPNLKIDTHKNNIPMQKAILRECFVFTGIIYLADGAPRRAYEWLAEKKA